MAIEIPPGLDDYALEEELYGFEPTPIRVPFLEGDQIQTIGLGPQQPIEVPPELWRRVAREPIAPADLMQGLVPISRLAPSAQTVQNALDVLASSSPELSQAESEELLLRKEQPPDVLSKTVAGVEGSLLRGAESMTSPAMLATAGLATAPAAVGRIASGAFAAHMASQVPEASKQLKQAIETKDPEKIAASATDLAQLVTFTATAAKHAITSARPASETLLPRSAQALRESGAPTGEALNVQISAGKEPSVEATPSVQGPASLPARSLREQTAQPQEPANAIQEQQAKEVLRDVPEQPGVGQQAVPAKEGAERVPPGDLPIEQAAGREAATVEAAQLPVSPLAREMVPEGAGIGGQTKKIRMVPEERRRQEGAISLAPIQALVNKAAPAVKSAWEAVVETGKEALTADKMTDTRRSVLNWSAKLQKSFGEAGNFQKNIQRLVPNKVRREAITNWIQAGGDAKILAQRAAATKDKKLKKGYEAALKLTPEELQVANEVKNTYGNLATRGQAADVLGNLKDNYTTQIWKDVGGAGRGTGRTLKENFKFSKARTFDSFFDGEQAGFTPKTKDISELLPVYSHEMNNVIAAREMVEQLSKGVGSDGEPLVMPRGVGIPVDGPKGQATLIIPKAIKGDTLDYKVIPNQPALQNWTWATKDSAGNPVFLKSDLALHPEAYKKLTAVLGRSAIREWYQTPTTRLAAIPKALVRGLDAFNSETKRTMLGLLAPFHQVQTGTHGLGHRVNPFGAIPEIDLVAKPTQMDAANHGLMLLPDRASQNQFMEGLRTSGIISKIPVVGKVSDFYAEYLFQRYIPGLKFKTYEAILGRNQKVYAKDLTTGKVNLEDIKVLSAEQANAAYGHLNYADLGRNPTMQHFWQLVLLAPDFLEARGRFAAQAGKGVAGGKAGREQLLALGTLAVLQAAGAYITAQLADGEWDPKHPFEVTIGPRRYTIRSVPEDIDALRTHTRTFVHSRLSPIVGRGTVQYLSERDYAGRKVSPGQTTKELLTQPIPLTLRSLPGIREVSGAARPGAIKWWEQLAGAVGLKISRFNPNQKITELHTEWLKNNPDPIIKQDFERNQVATYPVSKYRSLDAALDDADAGEVMKAIQELRPLVRKDADIKERMRPYIGEGLSSRRKPLFHESEAVERKFVKSLNPEGRLLYERAVKERQKQWLMFLDVWRQRGPRPATQAPATAPQE